ncbi:hypothetical protein LOK49_LG14G01825 [Camellia lanceoleosa]|uniref:Uncharacterized protein n=1 Tax=Camellia lanceoleosa TaxID=1840588 RepID=A0ACC0FAD7_9ERIC|nr:hypothetical protein LOK49_LG14G01825 [Camellia lanceoleosa]
MGSLTQHKLPIIDFTKENLKPGTSSWDKTSKQVLSALEEYGCFVAVYDHEVSYIHSGCYKAAVKINFTHALRACHCLWKLNAFIEKAKVKVKIIVNPTTTAAATPTKSCLKPN